MSLKIEVKRVAVAERSGVGDSGKPWSMREQVAYAHLSDREGVADEFPTKIVVILEDGAKPYPPGQYTLAERSFYAGQYGKLTLGRVVLVPVAPVGSKGADGK